MGDRWRNRRLPKVQVLLNVNYKLSFQVRFSQIYMRIRPYFYRCMLLWKPVFRSCDIQIFSETCLKLCVWRAMSFNVDNKKYNKAKTCFRRKCVWTAYSHQTYSICTQQTLEARVSNTVLLKIRRAIYLVVLGQKGVTGITSNLVKCILK